MRALPFHYKDIQANESTLLSFIVDGEGGGSWFLYRLDDGWILVESADKIPDLSVNINGDIAWRIFSKGISAEEARKGVRISGNQEWGEHFLTLIAVMA